MDTIATALMIAGLLLFPFIVLVCLFALEYFSKSNYLLTAAIRRAKAAIPVAGDAKKTETVPEKEIPDDNFDIAEARKKLGLEPDTGNIGSKVPPVVISKAEKDAVSALKTDGKDNLPPEKTDPLKPRRKHRKKV